MWRIFLFGAIIGSNAGAQEASRVVPAPPPAAVERVNGRILWIIPNSTTCPMIKDFRPITTAEKFRIATRDVLDPGTFALGAVFAGKGQWTNSDPSLGQGAAGYARRFGTAYGDFAIGDWMTEGVFPSLLRQDPRYFRKGEGSRWSRLGYAASRTFVTFNDSGKRGLNYSEFAGNAAAVALSNAYYADDRRWGAAAGKWGIQIGLDLAANIMKEFWPDLQRRLRRKPADAGRAQTGGHGSSR